MVKQLSRVFAVLAPAVFTVLAAAAPAGAGALTPPTEPLPVHGSYHLEVEFADGTVYDTVLVCPGGGAHPHGSEVCGQLAEVGGRIAALPRTGGMCTMDYRPVTVRAHGLWGSAFRSYQGRFGNYCVAVGRTGGHLFDLAPR